MMVCASMGHPFRDEIIDQGTILGKWIGFGRRRRDYSSGFCRMMTLVPTGTRS